MEIILNRINEYERELSVTVPWEMIEDEYNDILKKYARLPVKGFRPGKAPVGAVESFFKNHIKNDLISASSGRLCRKAMKEKETEAGTPAEISETELTKNDCLKFKASYIEMPRFTLPDYRNLNLTAGDTEDKLNEISLKLLEQTNIDLHPAFTDRELRYSDHSDEPTDEEKAAAADRVKLMMILKKIADIEGIETDEKDVETRIDTIAKENDVTPDELRDYLINGNGLSRLADSLLAESVLAYIVEIN